MNPNSAALLYLVGVFSGIFCSYLGLFFIVRGDKEEPKKNEYDKISKEEFDRLEDLSNDLKTMESVLGLSNHEKEVLNDASCFITNIIESTENPYKG